MKEHSGQVALIMVLIMTVVSAVAVSLASRSTIETRIQEMNVDNLEALLTAQSGLEESISKNLAVSGSPEAGKTYEVTLSDAGSSGVTSEKINSGETMEIDLNGAVGVTGLKIFWKPAVSGSFPAIFVSDVRSDQTINYAYDVSNSNGFTQILTGGTLEGVNYSYSTSIEISSEFSKKLKITVLGSAAFLGIQPVGGLLSSQSTNFRAVADVASTNQSVVKYGIEYVESKTDEIPSVFDYVLFSGGSIVQ